MSKINYRQVFILIVIIVFASWIRLYQSSFFFPFWQEQADDLVSVRSIWQDIREGNITHLSLKGQTGTYRWSWINHSPDNPIYHGVFYYYFLLPAAVIGNFDPYAVVLFLIGIGIAVVYLLYESGKLLFDDQWIGLVAAALGAMSFWLAAYSRFIWTPSTIPFFTLLSLVAFLRLIRGGDRWWYVLAFSLSAGSQVHNSGYVPLFFFLGALAWVRPPLPKGIWGKFLLISVFLLPILPTILSEITSSFKMVRALWRVGDGSTGVISLWMSLGFWGSLKGVVEGVGTFVLNSLGFINMNHRFFPTFFSKINEIIRTDGASLIGLISLLAVWVWRRTIIGWWWFICIPIPFFVEFLYIDQKINDYSRMNNLLFALPVLIICLSYMLVHLWRRRGFIARSITVGVFSIYIVINGLVISTYLWQSSDGFWDYGELSTLTTTVSSFVNQPYNLIVHSYSEGTFTSPKTYEMLYLLDTRNLPMPETFNGVTHWSINNLSLGARTSGETIYVIDKSYRLEARLPPDAIRVGSTVNFLVYRSFDVQKAQK